MKVVTRLFDGDVDLSDVARKDGFLFVRHDAGIAGRGVALRGDAAAIRTAMATAEVDNPVGGAGTGPVAIGCVPFLPGRPADLIIPAVLVGKDEDGRAWVTTIDGADEQLMVTQPTPATASFTVEPLTDTSGYLAAVATARDAVADGRLRKAVISRDVSVRCSMPIDLHAVLLRLKASFGSSYRYSFDGFVGASPELLIHRNGSTVISRPVAGTAPRTGDPTVDQRIAEQLIASMKDQVEHRVVIDVIHDMLLPFCSYLDWEPEPSIVAVANVQHLGTYIEGRLSEGAPDALELASFLSPTPALGGHPRDEALALIAEVEGRDRGRYGGTIGWLDADGNGTWAVAIRCAQFSDDRTSAVLSAGGGIVAASEPLAELAETQAKFQAMLAAIVRA